MFRALEHSQTPLLHRLEEPGRNNQLQTMNNKTTTHRLFLRQKSQQIGFHMVFDNILRCET
jgi:hypothetical protein